MTPEERKQQITEEAHKKAVAALTVGLEDPWRYKNVTCHSVMEGGCISLCARVMPASGPSLFTSLIFRA